MKHPVPFCPADILLPRRPETAWAVVACDQYTSEPNYWASVDAEVGDAPSTLRLTLPEVYLKDADLDERIDTVNRTMHRYLAADVFTEYQDAMILVERTLADGRVRKGIVGAIDLGAYDHAPDTKALIRATEGTVLSRIPPRVAIRRDAPLELPHVMLLMDDPANAVIGAAEEGKGEAVYDIPLMQGSGSVRGFLLPPDVQDAVRHALEGLMVGEEPMLFAVGDGNHSLATAKACAALYPDCAPAARALVEVVNIHDPALDFEPIYRVLFGVDVQDVIDAAKEHFAQDGESTVTLIAGDREETVMASGLISEAVQSFLDAYIAAHPEAEIDYIHGEEVVRALAAEQNTVGFLFAGMDKQELFPYVSAHGPLPRKTFSMGEAHDKRFYLEARRIR